MSWRTVDESDLAATLSQSEVDMYRRDGAADGSDRISTLLAHSVAFARDAVRQGGRCAALGPAGTLPDALVPVVMDYAMGKVLTALAVPLNDDRRRARDDAKAYLERVAAGEIAIPSYGIDDETSTGTSAIEVVTSSRLRATPPLIEGI